MQNHIYQETGKFPSLRETGEVLQSYLDNNTIVLAGNSKYNISANSLMIVNSYTFLNN